MNGLYVDSVIKHFGYRLVLSDVYLNCTVGEVIGLLGRNGTGKSTLLEIIFGSLKADNKFVTVNDKLIRSVSDCRNLIAYLPQKGYLPNHLRIKSAISVFCTDENAAALRETDVIKPLLKKKAGTLSGGELRLVEILLLLYSEARYLLLDEPFNGVAPLQVDIIKDLIRKHSASKGFIITDHDYRNVLDMSTSIILLHDGRTSNITSNDELIQWGYLPEHALTVSW